MLFNLIDKLKEFLYHKLNQKEKCICGGKIKVRQTYYNKYGFGYEARCNLCNFLYDEE